MSAEHAYIGDKKRKNSMKEAFLTQPSVPFHDEEDERTEQFFAPIEVNTIEMSEDDRKLKAKCSEMAKVLKKFHTKEMANIEKEWEIPTALWNAAKAILIIKKGKVGAGVSVECGTGVMIRRLDGDKWSAPSCVSLAGAGIGWQVGVSMTHIVMVMLSDSGVERFMRMNQAKLGADLACAIYTGSRAELCPWHLDVVSFSRHKGLFVGLSLDGCILSHRPLKNWELYNQKVKVDEILDGRLQVPECVAILHDALDLKCKDKDSKVPLTWYDAA